MKTVHRLWCREGLQRRVYLLRTWAEVSAAPILGAEFQTVMGFKISHHLEA